jgi:L-malate glycosyltransferase
MNIVPQTYWDDLSEQVELEFLDAKDPIRLLINKYIPVTQNGTAFEAGCYPGRFLAVFGDLNYTLHGLDTTPRVQEVTKKLTQHNYNTGTIINGDFTQLSTQVKYTVVSSFGFIEHFENYLQVIDKHCTHVEENGYLVISAPNFRHGIPYLFHRWLNTDSFYKHVIESMRPSVWEQQVKQNGFTVLFSGYCGGIDLWQSGKQGFIQKHLSIFFIRLLKVLKLVFFWVDFRQLNSKYLSSDFMVIAKKHVAASV